MNRVRRKAIVLYTGLLAANLAVWGWAFAAFHGNAVLLGTALIAYGFGLRHAVDADHIAAIDNVTRKLVQQGRRPVAVGLFFALGHSTIVLVAAAIIASSASTLQQRFPGLAAMGATIGTLASALFLFAIGTANLVVLHGLYRLFRRLKSSDTYREDEIGSLLEQRGPMGRLMRGVFRLISRSWHMYPVGLLFALGFDTASEIGVLGISAAEAAKGLTIWSILIFPALFTAGMALVDAIDGVLMLQAYGWALVNPVRKLYYNLAITGLSAAVALIVGGVEALGLIADKRHFTGGFWDLVSTVSDNFAPLGYAIIAIFAVSWFVSFLVYRLRGYGKISA